MSQIIAPRPIVPELLRPANSFAISASKGRSDVVVFFEFDHPGAPGQVRPVAQIAMSPELLRRMHAVFGRALEHLELDEAGTEPAPLSLEDMPANVRQFPPRPAPAPEGG